MTTPGRHTPEHEDRDPAEEGSADAVLAHLPGLAYLCEHDEDFTVRHVWGEVEALVGLSPDELVGRDFSTFIHPDDLEMVHREVSAAVGAGKPYDLRYRVRRRDGTIRWVWEQGGRTAGGGLLEGLILDVTGWVEAEQERAELETRHRSLLEHLDEAVVLVDDGLVVYANAATEELLRTGGESVVGRRVTDIVHPDDVARARRSRSLAPDQPGRPERRTHRIVTDDGEELEVNTQVTTVQLQGCEHLQVVIRDISAIRRTARFRHGVDELLARAASGEDADQILVDLARLAEERLGTRRCLIATVHRGRLHVRAAPNLPPALRDFFDDGLLASMTWLERALRKGRVATGVRFVRRSRSPGTDVPATSRGWVVAASTQTSGDDVLVLVMGNEHRPPEELDTDIAHEVRNVAAAVLEQAQRQQAVDEAALVDGLTGLPSRAAVIGGLRRALDETPHGRVTVLAVAIDELARVDESLGHDAGDALVLHVARALEMTITARDMIGRLVDGRFAVVCPGLGDREIVERRIAALRAGVGSVPVDHHVLHPSISVGVATARPGSDADALLSEAIGALDQARAGGSGRTCWFDEADRGRALRRLETEIALRKGLDGDEIVAHYQPRVRLCDGVIVGAEALARWERPGIGMVGPAEFIALAEEIALVGAIDRTVLRQACTDAAGWPHDGDPLTISVNLSAAQLADPHLVDVVTDALDTGGLAPTRLILEVTEGTMVDALGPSTATLDALRALGVRIAIDDFGTGYSSLAYLKRLDVDELKIDRSFVVDLPNDDDVALVGAICSVAGMLGIDVVAEGVETEQQRITLLDLGCELAQGFLWSPPVAPERFTQLLAHPSGSS